MFNLIIYKEDGSVYWSEYFDSRNELNKWLDVEKTRHYWDSKFTHQVIDNSPTQQQKDDEQAAIDAVKLAKKTQRNAIRGIKNANNIAQLKVAFIELIKYLDIGDQDEV